MAAPTIVWRYVLREVTLYALLGMSAFALLLVAGNLLKDIELLQIVAGELAMLARLLAALLPAYLSYMIPAALLCGVMLALSRMSADGEIVALHSVGLGTSAVLIPVLALGVVSVGLIAYVTFDLGPRSHYQLRELRRELIASSSMLQTGRVRRMGEGRTLYVAERGDSILCPLQGVLISDLSQAERPFYVAARCGRIVELGAGDSIGLALQSGAVHSSRPGSDRYDRIAFTDSTVEMALSDLDFFERRLDHYRLSELLFEEIPRYSTIRVQTEIHQRLSFLFSGLVLALLGIPLGMRPARRGRSAGTVTGALVLSGYWCAITTAQLAADDGLVPPWFNWLPNLAVLLLGAVLLRGRMRGEGA